MSESVKEIHQKVFSAEFNEFCKKQFSKDMMALEEERKKALLCVALIVSVVTIVFLVVFLFSFQRTTYEENTAIFSIYIALLTLVHIPICKYKKNSKTKIMPKLLAFVGDFKIVYDSQKRTQIHKYVKTLSLFDTFNSFSMDDVLEGVYNGINVSVSEMCLKYKYKSKKNKNEKIVFKGVMLSFKSFKKFSSKTLIKKDCIKIFQDSRHVNLEDVEFERLYDVESEDQIEARYLITPAFMNRMVEYSKINQAERLSVSFEYGNVNIAIHNTKDWFDIPIFTPATEISIYSGVLLDLVAVLKIIDALKMEQNIGM